MVFTSIEFLIFFAVFVPIFFLLPRSIKSVFLLLASYFFYAYWNFNYLLLIIGSTLVDFVVSQRIYDLPSDKLSQKKTLLIVSLCINLGVLFIFKYFNLFSGTFFSLASLLGLETDPIILDLILPVGISFYTFQSMSYTIDIYYGKLKPERDFKIFATYIAFFPQLVAGPIERASNMLPQFHHNQTFSYDRTVSGLRLIIWGFFKKVAIADALALYVNRVYEAPSEFGGNILIIATLFFAVQIYCDFSGYSDIAIGVARILGYDLMENFRQPYFSRSIREFWQRWHISLSTWFRDYVYIPLGGNRVSLPRNLMNLMIVFVVSGLWHGANWTFVLWGSIHGSIIVVETVLQKYNVSIFPKNTPSLLRNFLNIIMTFSIVTLAWIFFRANTINDALYIVTHLFSSTTPDVISPLYGQIATNTRGQFQTYLVYIAILVAVDARLYFTPLDMFLMRLPTILRHFAYYGLIVIIIVSVLLSSQQGNAFIYFQF